MLNDVNLYTCLLVDGMAISIIVCGLLHGTGVWSGIAYPGSLWRLTRTGITYAEHTIFFCRYTCFKLFNTLDLVLFISFQVISTLR